MDTHNVRTPDHHTRRRLSINDVQSPPWSATLHDDDGDEFFKLDSDDVHGIDRVALMGSGRLSRIFDGECDVSSTSDQRFRDIVNACVSQETEGHESHVGIVLRSAYKAHATGRQMRAQAQADARAKVEFRKGARTVASVVGAHEDLDASLLDDFGKDQSYEEDAYRYNFFDFYTHWNEVSEVWRTRPVQEALENAFDSWALTEFGPCKSDENGKRPYGTESVQIERLYAWYRNPANRDSVDAYCRKTQIDGIHSSEDLERHVNEVSGRIHEAIRIRHFGNMMTSVVSGKTIAYGSQDHPVEPQDIVLRLPKQHFAIVSLTLARALRKRLQQKKGHLQLVPDHNGDMAPICRHDKLVFDLYGYLRACIGDHSTEFTWPPGAGSLRDRTNALWGHLRQG